MILGMIVGATLIVFGAYIGIQIRPKEEKQEEQSLPTTRDGKYFSTQTAIRDIQSRGDD